MRTGIGYDLHKLVDGRKLFIGGVEIPFEKGSLGHSDGDVLLHAISDALLGAAACGDIGMHFPDTSDQFKDISSIELLKRSLEIVNKKKRCKIINIDTIVICDEPKIGKYSDSMKKVISTALAISIGDVNIKAKTTEKTDQETISAFAVVNIETK